MIKIISTFGLLILTYFLYGFYLAAFDVDAFPPQLHRQHPLPFYDYKGVTNVYSDLSLGTGDYKLIVNDAKNASLDFLFITDLNLFENNLFPEGYHDNLLLLFANKYSYLDSRLLFYSTKKKSLGANLGEVNIQITDLISQNTDTNKESLFVLTHPFLKGFNWTGDYPQGLDGIEIINFKRIQQKHFEDEKVDSFISLLMYPFNPPLGFIRLFDEPTQELALLDELQKEKQISAHLGLEATAKAVPITGSTIHFPSYETIFKLGSQHVLLRSELTGNSNSDKIKIIKALKAGEFYLCLDLLGNPKGFSAYIKNGENLNIFGSQIPFTKNLKFYYTIPKPTKEFEIVIYKNGVKYKAFQTESEQFDITEKGNYRLEVRLKLDLPFPMKSRWVTWLFTNSFYIK